MTGPGGHVTDVLETELTSRTASLIASEDYPGPCYGVLGIDGEDRVVSYWDDGVLIRTPIVDGELAERGHPDYESGFKGFSPHDTEGAVLAMDTGDWNWIHPRYRWLVDTEVDI